MQPYFIRSRSDPVPKTAASASGARVPDIASAIGNLWAERDPAGISFPHVKSVLPCIARHGRLQMEALIAALESNSTQREAIWLLTGMGPAAANDRVLKPLLEQLRHPESTIRSSAAFALRSMGIFAADERTLELMLPLLPNDEVATARTFIGIATLSWIGHTLARFRRLLRAPEIDIRRDTLRVFGEFGAADESEEFANQLIELFRDPEWWIRRDAVEALGKMQIAGIAPRVWEGLIPLLRANDRDVRITALEAFGKLGAAAAHEQVFAELLPLLLDPDYAIRHLATTALEQIGIAEADEWIRNQLLRNLSDPRYDVRANVLNLLRTQVAARPFLLDSVLKLLEDENEYARGSAVAVVGKMGVTIAGDQFFNEYLPGLLLIDPSKGVRLIIARILQEAGLAAGKPQVLDLLIDLLDDADGWTQTGAAAVLIKMGFAVEGERILDRLLPLLGQPAGLQLGLDVADSVFNMLEEMGEVSGKQLVVRRLLQLFCDPACPYRIIAGQLLGQPDMARANRSALEELIPLLHNPEESIRDTAAVVFGSMGAAATDEEILEHLAPLLRDPAPDVRAAAAIALGRIGRQEARGCIFTLLCENSEDPEFRPRNAKVRALGECLDAAANPLVLAKLVELLGHGELHARQVARDALNRRLGNGARWFDSGSGELRITNVAELSGEPG